ncbi:MAG: DUF4097 domain-containing protein [Lachnospiraceae bacterium]|nr:DUF4097 domain-containing protein [Lachnospiraceae bacterium]
MKKNIWMAVLTVITACCVVGGTFHYYGIFGFRNGFRFGEGRLTSADSDLEAFYAVNVDADMIDLSIESGEKFYLNGRYTDGLMFEYEVKDGILYIKQRLPKKALWGGMRSESCNVTLTVPEGKVMDFLDIRTAMGNIDVEGITSSDCEVQTSMGNCTFDECNFDEADICTNMGEITVKDTHLGEAELDNDMGTIIVERSTFDNLSADNSMGDISIDAEQNLDKCQIELESGMGNVKVNGHNEGTKYRQTGDAGKLEASTSMGSLKLNYRNAE